MKRNNKLPKVFKSATFIFLSILLFGVALLVTSAAAPIHEVWFSVSMLLITGAIAVGLIACVYRDKTAE